MYNRKGDSYPTFAQPSPDNKAIWGPVFEKAWAKVKGNYLNSEEGFNQEAMIALTGIPVFSYNRHYLKDAKYFS